MNQEPKIPQLSNGKAGGDVPLPDFALPNTNPLAISGMTLGATFGTKIVRTISGSEGIFSGQSDNGLRTRWTVLHSGSVLKKAEPKRVAGHVKLFKAVIDDWNFSEKDAATLLGFEGTIEIRGVFSGLRSVGQRDANDRLRAVLRIAADLYALYKKTNIIRGWLDQPQAELRGKSPKELLTEGSMENLLLVRYYVSQLSGR